MAMTETRITQEHETVLFMEALKDTETRAKIIELLKEAGLLPLSPRRHD